MMNSPIEGPTSYSPNPPLTHNITRAVPAHVLRRKTRKIVALGMALIGITMVLSSVPQCIYVGIAFIIGSILWLLWIRWVELNEKTTDVNSTENPHGRLHQINSHGTVSPVLFLISPHVRSQNWSSKNDKPPTYEEYLKMDGLPPDYISSVFSNKNTPPTYDEITKVNVTWPVTIPIELELAAAANRSTINSNSSTFSPSNSPNFPNSYVRRKSTNTESVSENENRSEICAMSERTNQTSVIVCPQFSRGSSIESGNTNNNRYDRAECLHSNFRKNQIVPENCNETNSPKYSRSLRTSKSLTTRDEIIPENLRIPIVPKFENSEIETSTNPQVPRMVSANKERKTTISEQNSVFFRDKNKTLPIPKKRPKF